MSLDLIAIIFPKPGKTDRIVQLSRELGEYVKKNEPGTLKYEIMKGNKDKKTGKEEVVMVEKYKDKDALQIHAGSARFARHVKTMEAEDLTDGPSKIMIMRPAGGFSSRL